MTVKTVMAALVAAVLGGVIGAVWFGGSMDHAQVPMVGDGPCEGGAQPLYWVAPMDASYRRDGPGKSPMGMELVPFCGGEKAAGVDVSIDPQVVMNMGVRTAPATRGRLVHPLHATARVSYDEDSYAMIHARAEGWLEGFAVESVGARVTAGQELYALFAPKLVAAEGEYLAARQSGRAELMRGARDRLLALGYTPAQVKDLDRRGEPGARLIRRAPADAVVAMLGARDGQFVTPGTHILTLADLSTVWMLVDVLERDAGRVAVGQSAVATVDAYPGREWTGTVAHVYPELDPVTRTLPLRLVFDNADGALKPHMLASVTVETPAAEDALLIPRAALIRQGRGDRVIVALGEGQFRVAPVTAGRIAGDRAQILEGLEAGEAVVVDGQFLLDSEANVDAEARRMAMASPPAGVAHGIVRAVMDGRLKLEHGPVEPLGPGGIAMPGMTMMFDLAPGVDASTLSVGQRVEARIESPRAGQYRVADVAPMAMDEEAMPDMGADDTGPAMPMAHDDMPMTGTTDQDDGAMSPQWTRATVVAVDPAAGQITLAHEDMPMIGMPAMTMGFVAAPDVELNGFEPGQAVRFTLRMDETGMRVTALEPAP